MGKIDGASGLPFYTICARARDNLKEISEKCNVMFLDNGFNALPVDTSNSGGPPFCHRSYVKCRCRLSGERILNLKILRVDCISLFCIELMCHMGVP